MKTLIALSMLLLTSCGFNGKQKLETNDAKQTVEQTGESYTYIVVRLEFIKEIKDLCLELNPVSDFEKEDERNKIVAQCTFDNLSLINISPTITQDFTNEYCQEPTEDINIIEACEALNIL